MEGWEGRSLSDPSAGISSSGLLAIIFLGFGAYGIYKFFLLNRHSDDYRGWVGVTYIFFLIPASLIGFGLFPGIGSICLTLAHYFYFVFSDEAKKGSKIKENQIPLAGHVKTFSKRRSFKTTSENSIIPDIVKNEWKAAIIGQYAAVLRSKTKPTKFVFYDFDDANYYRDASLSHLLKDENELDDWELRYLKVDENYTTTIQDISRNFKSLYNPYRLPILHYCTIQYLISLQTDGSITGDELKAAINARRELFGIKQE